MLSIPLQISLYPNQTNTVYYSRLVFLEAIIIKLSLYVQLYTISYKESYSQI
jgi:hypothetical protein